MHDTNSKISLLESCREFYAPVWEEMLRVEAELQETISSNDAFTTRVSCHGFQLSGKRMRPALLLLFAQAVGEIRPAHILLAAAGEMVHTASLIHDDILDEAAERRHLPTVNRLWNNETSVLLGDFFVARAIRKVTSLQNPEFSHIFAEACCRLCEGEMRQVGSRGDYDLSEEKYNTIIADKTAALFECVCRLGVLAAFTDDSPAMNHPLVSAAARFGNYLGMAFQIVDDLLDICGDEENMGKSLGTDLEKQKITLPVIRFLNRLPAEEKSAFIAELQHGDSCELRFSLRRRMAASGVEDEVLGVAENYLSLAVAELADFPESDATKSLLAISRFVTERKK